MRRWIAMGAGLLLGGCSSSASTFPGTPDAAPDAPPVDPPPVFTDEDAGAGDAGCTDLKCRQVTCSGEATTSVSGTVYAPNGTLPLYNAIVYVPNGPLSPITSGATCEQCATTVSGSPIVTALTDANGKFTLKNVPVGSNIPVVIQVGKWRRTVVLPQVDACTDNPVANGTLHLPRNQAEGDMPRIAVTTGGCDPLACLLPKLGIDATEFGVSSSGTEKVILYKGQGQGPPGMQQQTALWNSAAELKKFDIAMLACDCSEDFDSKSKPAEMKAFVDGGGRVFASHFHYIWPYAVVPAWNATANFIAETSAVLPALVDTKFPKGKALADWLAGPEVLASTTYGQLPVNEPRMNVAGVHPTMSTKWVTDGTGKSMYYSFNAPVEKPPAEQCGKWVHAAMHVGAAAGTVGPNFPVGCTSGLSPEEKSLAYFFFDLSSCIQPDKDPPKPPDPK